MLFGGGQRRGTLQICVYIYIYPFQKCAGRLIMLSFYWTSGLEDASPNWTGENILIVSKQQNLPIQRVRYKKSRELLRLNPCFHLCPSLRLCLRQGLVIAAREHHPPKKKKSTGDVFVKLIRKYVIAFQKVVQFAFGGNCPWCSCRAKDRESNMA